MDRIEEFAKGLMDLGTKHSADLICQYAEELILRADNFDIDKIQKLIREFPGLVKKLTGADHGQP